MTDDPIADLRAQLFAAAHRLQVAHIAPGVSLPASPRSSSHARAHQGRRGRWRGRPLLAAVLALAVAAPAGAALSGALDLGSGSTPGGGTYRVTERTDARSSAAPATTDARGRTCQDSEFRSGGKLVLTVTGCAPADTKSTDPFVASVVEAPGASRLVTATVSEDVARVEVSGVATPIALRALDGKSRRFLQVVTTASPVTVVAYDRDGIELQRSAAGL